MSKEPPIRHVPNLRGGRANLSSVIRYTALVGLGGHLLFIPIFLWLNVWPMAAVNVASCAIFAVCYWLNRRGHPHSALVVGALEVTAHASLAVLCLGWSSGFHYYILSLAPLVFYSPQWRLPTKIVLAAALCSFYIALYSYSLKTLPWARADAGRLYAAGIFNIITLFVVFAALAYYYRLAATDAESALTQANQVLEYQAHTDPLTRLSNRREMQASISTALDVYRLRRISFSVVLGDIDDFKLVNDRYGHEAGDSILVTLADLMRADLRGPDRVARWGGEEFLMFLAATPLEQAKQVAERLRERIAATRIAIGDETVSITMTLGVAEYTGEVDAVACIRRADEAMYIGKRNGKNQVVSAPAAPNDFDLPAAGA